MNIYDISEKAGVSIATVSRVLNGNSRVSEKTRQKILKVMEETGYQPNVFARGLGLNTMHTIGILCADSSDIVLSSAVYNVEQELHKYQYNALLCCTGYGTEEKKNYLELLLGKGVDAVILVGSNFAEAEKEKNQYVIDAAKKVPIVILNGYLDAPNIYCVLCDDSTVMERVTSSFLTNKRKILYLYRTLTYSGRQKLQGVRNAFQNYKETMSEDQIRQFNGSIEETKQFLLTRRHAGDEWDVIITSDDELAVGACKFAKAADIKIPDELQIMGYNNSVLSISRDPEISSIENHLNACSKMAVSVVMKVLKKEKVPVCINVCGDIIPRGTTIDL